MRVRNILCAVDPADASGLVPGAAVEMVKQYQASITFVSIVPEIDAASTSTSFGILGTGRRTINLENSAAKAEREQAVVDSLRPWRESAENGTTGEVELEVRHGQPADILIAHAQSGDFDLVVIGGGSKKGGFMAALLGSICEKVVRGAACSVLVVRGEEH